MAKMYCPNCGTVAKPKVKRKGSGMLELFLILLAFVSLLIPVMGVGLFAVLILAVIIYDLYRFFYRYRVCPSCYALNPLPLKSPRAIAELERRNR